MAQLSPPEFQRTEADIHELLALLERVSRSAQLQRAARLREFLLYIGKQSILDGKTDLREQEIGCSIFGRPLNYDTSHDNIVRVNATELRKRLESYFTSEGARESWIIEIPRGGYTPVFSRRAVTIPEASASKPIPEDATAPAIVRETQVLAHLSPETSQSRAYPQFLFWMLLAITLVLATACAWLIWQNRTLSQEMRGWQATPTLRAFWQNFLAEDTETDVVLADTSFGLEQDILKTSFPLNDYLNYSYKILPREINPDTKAAVEIILSRNNGSISDFRTANRILMLAPNSSLTHLRFARDYIPEVLKRNNLILIGSKKSNPWVELFQDRLEFDFAYDSTLKQFGVRNLRPRQGEPRFFAEPSDPSTNIGYGIVAFLPNVGPQRDALLIEGTDSQATEAAGEFMTHEESMVSLKRRMNVDTFPYFQLLLKTSRLSGTPFTSEILAVRTYPGRIR